MTSAELIRAAAAFPGEAGSGLQRYAAAMSLYQQRIITDETLEVFRICAPDDRLDPLAELTRLKLTADLATLQSGDTAA